MRATHLIVRRFLEAEGGRVSYLTVDGAQAPETLLLIHGAGVSARTWVNQLRGLTDALRPIAIDLPGRCGSDPTSDPTLATYAHIACQALERLHTGPVFVAGHSLGGGVAQLLAMRHPDKVKGLILISTCAKVPPADGAMKLFGFVPPPFRRVVLLWMSGRVLFAPSTSWQAIQLTLNEIRDCRLATLQSDAAVGRAMDLVSTAQRLRVPTLILCGGRDRLTVPALSQQLNALIPGSRLEIVPSAGHMLPLEAPEIVNRTIRDFVHTVTPEVAVRHGLRRLLRRLAGWGRV